MITTQQQIHSHLKKVHVSRFPVVSNKAIQDCNSVAVNNHTKSFKLLSKTVNEWMSSEASASSWSRHFEKYILRQTVPQELDKVLSIKFYAEVTKRNRDTKKLECLKIIQSAIERCLKEKTLHSWALCSLGSFTTQKKSNAELHQLHPQSPSSKTTRSVSLNHRRKEGLPSLIQGMRNKLWCMKETIFVLTSELLVCLTSFCKLNKVSNSFRFRHFKLAWLGTLHQNLKFKAIKLCDFKMDLIKW